MDVRFVKTERQWGVSLAVVIYASDPRKWAGNVLASFASQYGNPMAYPLILRAKLVGTHGETNRVLDIIYQAVLKPWNKNVKSLFQGQDNQKQPQHMSQAEIEDWSDFLGLDDPKKENADGSESNDSNSVDEGPAVA